MLTPSFELQQNKDFLTIIIKAPFAKVADAEIFIEENDFKFYSKPYFLRLTLPGNIVEDGREKADYDVDKGIFTVVVAKETSGEHFEGLDMITKLLAPKPKMKETSSLIEVVGDSEVNVAGDNDDDGDDDDDDFDWCIEQEPYIEKLGLLEAPKYGFANQKSGVFQRLQEDMVYIVDCPDPDKQNVTERRELRLQSEWEKFDEDHYISDLIDDEGVKQLLQYKPRFYEELSLVNNGLSVDQAGTGELLTWHKLLLHVDQLKLISHYNYPLKSEYQPVYFDGLEQEGLELTDEEQEVLLKLPRKEYILDDIEESVVYLGLLDIIYAYAYNHRSTEGENHCESGWTICKMSATLSWLEVFTSVHDVIRSCYRRSLCYPLYRHWTLNETVLQDLIQIFRLGRRCILKVLLEIRSILIDQDNRYVLNDLYITDYCVWIQAASTKRLHSLAEALTKMKMTKEDVGFNLPDIEELAKCALDAEGDDDDIDGVDDLQQKLQGTNIDDDREVSEESTDDDDDDVDSDTDTGSTDSDDVVCSGEEGTEYVKPTADCVDKLKENSNNLIQVIESPEGENNEIVEQTSDSVEKLKQNSNNLIKVIECTEPDSVCKDEKNENVDQPDDKLKKTDSLIKVIQSTDNTCLGKTLEQTRHQGNESSEEKSNSLIQVIESKDKIVEKPEADQLVKDSHDKTGTVTTVQGDLSDRLEQIGLT